MRIGAACTLSPQGQWLPPIVSSIEQQRSAFHPLLLPRHVSEPRPELVAIVTLPYIHVRVLSEPIQRVLQQLNIHVRLCPNQEITATEAKGTSSPGMVM